MSLHYVIDGYNIINHPSYANNALKTHPDPRLSLLAFIRIKKLSGSLRNKVTVVFDGYPAHPLPDYFPKDINIIFSRKISADDKIKLLIQESANRKNIYVVSDDRQIRSFAKSSGARTVAVEEFIDRKKNLSLKKEPPKPELTYTQMEEINRELKQIWFK